ncbi:hypothetical protein E2C01_034784 [Portunus trituberculatus]|uniref:Uncharacterized protein n=1 Tax=Portunus trituberculatus TaxID=210409 RepID=A0A5B7F6L7_PORTR|nr:hypothetical protein [Portunus trituberculatus]
MTATAVVHCGARVGRGGGVFWRKDKEEGAKKRSWGGRGRVKALVVVVAYDSLAWVLRVSRCTRNARLYLTTARVLSIITPRATDV